MGRNGNGDSSDDPDDPGHPPEPERPLEPEYEQAGVQEPGETAVVTPDETK